MVQNSASCQFAFWPDYCIASSKRCLPITVRLMEFQKFDGNTYIQHLLMILATMRDSMPCANEFGNYITNYSQACRILRLNLSLKMISTNHAV